jgi:hypothetical protein
MVQWEQARRGVCRLWPAWTSNYIRNIGYASGYRCALSASRIGHGRQISSGLAQPEQKRHAEVSKLTSMQHHGRATRPYTSQESTICPIRNHSISSLEERRRVQQDGSRRDHGSISHAENIRPTVWESFNRRICELVTRPVLSSSSLRLSRIMPEFSCSSGGALRDTVRRNLWSGSRLHPGEPGGLAAAESSRARVDSHTRGFEEISARALCVFIGIPIKTPHEIAFSPSFSPEISAPQGLFCP